MKKKILFVGGTTGGGVATVNNEVVKVFRAAGHSCVQVDTEAMKSRFPAPVAYVLAYILTVVKVLTQRPRVVYLQIAQSGYLHQSLFLLFAKFLGRETVAHFHAKADLKGACTPRHFRQIIDSQRYIDKMIVLTAPCRDCLVANGWRKEIHVVPNFISTENLPRQVGPIAERHRFLYLGRMDWEKGIFEILEIARRLGDEEFVFVGNFADDGQRRRFTEEIADVANARWLGSMYSDEKYDVIAESRYLLFPTRRDEFPMTLIESTILGCIPLVSPVGSVGEIIEDGYNGVHIPPGDVAAIVARIRELQAGADLQKMSDDGIACARSRFTSEAVRGALLEIVG